MLPQFVCVASLTSHPHCNVQVHKARRHTVRTQPQKKSNQCLHLSVSVCDSTHPSCSDCCCRQHHCCSCCACQHLDELHPPALLSAYRQAGWHHRHMRQAVITMRLLGHCVHTHKHRRTHNQWFTYQFAIAPLHHVYSQASLNKLVAFAWYDVQWRTSTPSAGQAKRVRRDSTCCS